MSNNTLILGLQWGDEGKGKIVDALAENSDAVCRFQGGHNACVMTTLKTAHSIGIFCQSIYNFSLTFITPLQAQDKGVVAHRVLIITF